MYHIAIILFFILAATVASRFLAHRHAVQSVLRRVPGPKASSRLWGEEWLLYHAEPGSQYVKWHKQYGRVVKFTGALGHHALSITDPRAISFILGEGTYNFPKPHGVREWFKATLGQGILWIEGKEQHERHRRALAPALSKQAVRKFTPIFYETSMKMAVQWAKVLDNSASDEVEIEITSWAGRFALDTVIRAAFSYDFNFLSGDHKSLLDALDGLTNNENKLSSFYMRALFWIFPSILSIGKKGEMVRQSKRELGDIALKMWRDAKVAGDADGKNLMALMLKADSDSGGKRMTEEEIVAQMRTTISAGYETVSALVAWVLYELAIHPNIQTRLREEIVASRSGELSADGLNSLPFLDAVLKETLRMHPPILENHHEAAETTTVPLSEPLPGTSEAHLIIPKGILIAIPVNVIQTEEWIHGADAHLFRPQRWLERQKAGVRHEREIFAFSEGPRVCIGKEFALTEIKALMTVLLRQFSFSCIRDIEPFQSFVVRPRIKGQGPSSLPLLVRRL
ncbi:cytochrome p450 [Moniliophthora roreri]|uniref:Cytochrome p450 n=1 Tax=Moniliophthora roreri TaxID=221103 RepID=A0A0W0F5P9_MONRR|nr:cytochrome p450 [Moniliophthora roreri]